MDKILFKEEQQFRQWWYLILVFGSIMAAIVCGICAVYQQAVKGVPFGDKPAPTGFWIGIIIGLGLLLWLFLRLNLEVWIDPGGIHYRFFPLIIKEKIISFEEIKKYEIRKYNPVIDYGGWGIKRNFRWGKAYNISGNIGLQLYLNNGKKVLFGTQRPEAILYAMDYFMTDRQKIK